MEKSGMNIPSSNSMTNNQNDGELSVRPKSRRRNSRKSSKGKIPLVKGNKVDKNLRRNKVGKNFTKSDYEEYIPRGNYEATGYFNEFFQGTDFRNSSPSQTLGRLNFGKTAPIPRVSTSQFGNADNAINRTKFSNTIQLPAVDNFNYRLSSLNPPLNYQNISTEVGRNDCVRDENLDLWSNDYKRSKLDVNNGMYANSEPCLGILHAKMEPVKRPECAFCKRNNAKDYFHPLKDHLGGVVCPVLSAFTCKMCAATGRNAHTHKYCPVNPITKGDPIAAGMPPGRPLTNADKEWLKYFHAKFLLQVLDGSRVLDESSFKK